MKRQTAKEILADSFRELAQTKNAEKITVNDICENCGYSPATFYRNFQDKYDLMAWCYAQPMGEIADRIGKDGYGWDEAYADSTVYFTTHKSYLANLFQHTSGFDAFINNMTDINCSIYREYLLKKTGAKQLQEKTEMAIRLYCLGASHLVSEWVLDKYRASAEELAQVLQEGLAKSLLSEDAE